MGWSVLDLSVVTDTLIGVINTAIQTSPLFTSGGVAPFAINVTGSAPDTARAQTGCQLNLYLLHVARDPHWRNMTVVTNPATNQPRVTALPLGTAAGSRQLPLALNLSYILTAFAGTDYHQEQQAMSIALHAFHEKAVYKTATEEFTIGVEADSIEEMSRLWQAVTMPIRLSAMFRVAVIFITPSDPPTPPAPPPTQAGIALGAGFAPPGPQLYRAAFDVTFGNIPAAPPADSVTTTLTPSVFVAGQTVLLGGAGLDQVGPAPQPFGLILQAPTSAPGPVPQWDVSSVAPPTGWIAQQTTSEIRLTLPTTYTAGTPAAPTTPPPTDSPVPGVYLLTVVNRATNQASLPIPFAIAASVINPNPSIPFPAALAANAAGVYTINGAGFASAPQTQVVLDVIGLTGGGASPPGAGQFFVTADGSTIQFALPSGLPAGRYFVRVRVNGVESPPNWWVDAT